MTFNTSRRSCELADASSFKNSAKVGSLERELLDLFLSLGESGINQIAHPVGGRLAIGNRGGDCLEIGHRRTALGRQHLGIVRAQAILRLESRSLCRGQFACLGLYLLNQCLRNHHRHEVGLREITIIRGLFLVPLNHRHAAASSQPAVVLSILPNRNSSGFF